MFGLHSFRLDRDARDVGEPVGEASRVGVIFRQSVDHLGERDDARGGEHARLAHAAAEDLAHASRLRHEVARAGEQRTDRGAESLGEAEHHAVDLRR